MDTFITLIHVFASVALIALVLLQQGKGADMGAAFGSGASSTVFGSRGSASFLTRTTGILATVFFITSLVLAYFAGQADRATSVIDNAAPAIVQPAAPSDVPAQEAAVPSAPAGGVTSDVPSPK